MAVLSVVIPAYNEESGIKDIAQRVLAVKPDLEKVGVGELELIIVDDCSKDRTAEIAGNILGVTLIQHAQNKGYGGALKTGFYQAKGDLIGFLDADGTYPPEYFPQLCEKALNGYELVIGSRMAGEESQMPPTRRLGNIIFANMLSILGRQHVSDSASGMRVFKKSVYERILPLPDGLNLTPVMSTRAIHEGINMVEVPIPYSERVGRSKLNIFHDGRIFFESILWTVLTYNPVRIFGMIGLGGIAFALLVAIGLIIMRINGITSLGPWGVAALFWAMVSSVSGISIFALGATFNYLVSLFYNQPIRQGLFGKPIFKPSLDHYFGWLGLIASIVGIVIALISLGLGVRGWEIARLWLYLLGSALFILVGIQLMIYWLLMRVLDELSQREANTIKDLGS